MVSKILWDMDSLVLSAMSFILMQKNMTASCVEIILLIHGNVKLERELYVPPGVAGVNNFSKLLMGLYVA
jgi:hypothetical protein